jgi:sporulation protein YlmC with PRC-barrel domain
MDINVELLLGTKVHDVNGEDVGRIEEFHVERDESSCRIDAYLVGASSLIDRLSAWTLVRPIAKLLNRRKLLTAYEIPWQDMDLSDPEHPKLRTARRGLRHIK